MKMVLCCRRAICARTAAIWGGICALLGALACGSDGDEETAAQALEPECGTAAAGDLPALKLTPIVTGLDLPTYVAAAPGDTRRLFVLEQEGLIRVVRDGQLESEPFVDLTDRVYTTLPAYSEYGLLGLAFHPDYESNGRVFVHYSAAAVDGENGNGDGVISELTQSGEGSLDPASERRLLVVPQPEGNHNGGQLAFGPDGFLYIGLGDGGGQGDPRSNGQNLGTLLGKMLRIDVNAAAADAEYGIPAGNMAGSMAGGGALPELWSYGLRNPWRFSFDACTGDMYIGDVGQNLFEEVDFEPANTSGRNYGWSVLESSSCFNDTPDDPAAVRASFTNPLESCDGAGLTPAVFEYNRTWGCSLTGGYVYRGHAVAGLRGAYLYADYCSGNFGSFRVEAGAATDQRDITDNLNPEGIISISSFGTDNAGELYVLSHSGAAFPQFAGDAGVLYRIDPE